jgi:hypothetical protein
VVKKKQRKVPLDCEAVMIIDNTVIPKNKKILRDLSKDLNKNIEIANKFAIANILDNPVILGVG